MRARAGDDPVARLPLAPFGFARGTIEGALRCGDGPQRRLLMTGRKAKWSADVTAHSDALDLEPKVFEKKSPSAIARSLKRSADVSGRRKSSAFRSAMSMLTFYINRAGRNLPAERKETLETAKGKLRQLFGRDR